MNIKDFFRRVKVELQLRNLPIGCQHCELLAMCRDETKGWTCRRGCMVLNAQRQREREERTYTLAEVERDVLGYIRPTDV